VVTLGLPGLAVVLFDNGTESQVIINAMAVKEEG
jgi:hypothetical protein